MNKLLHFLSDVDQTWYVYLLGHVTSYVGLILKFNTQGTRERPKKGKLGQMSFFEYLQECHIVVIYQNEH